ncbi:hypothetical protein DUI87_06407 [Hirundo rustica rustica]|uniref:Uncharacterized protein n=1 Tax=Hirundo rustica rustica TaxID=333673 RepID=A0A3M0KT47_HIRRU|nr:hypothetical protein DUI87_06407 [Hirundo rustica rustica]
MAVLLYLLSLASMEYSQIRHTVGLHMPCIDGQQVGTRMQAKIQVPYTMQRYPEAFGEKLQPETDKSFGTVSVFDDVNLWTSEVFLTSRVP